MVAWLSAWGCRHRVGRCSTQRHQGLWAMHVAPSHCASSVRAERVMPGAGTDPAFSRGSDGRMCANMGWWDMGTKICLSATCRGGQGMVGQMQLVKVAPFILGFLADTR